MFVTLLLISRSGLFISLSTAVDFTICANFNKLCLKGGSTGRLCYEFRSDFSESARSVKNCAKTKNFEVVEDYCRKFAIETRSELTYNRGSTLLRLIVDYQRPWVDWGLNLVNIYLRLPSIASIINDCTFEPHTLETISSKLVVHYRQ